MPLVRHIVLFSFKPGTSEGTVGECLAGLASLRSLVPGIVSYEHGMNHSEEGLGEGLEHGFVMTFESREARDAYLPHPEHERVKATLIPHLARVLVFDFETSASR